MLKFLTHKLRTHSLNEESPHQKVEDDDHDSGTESDDEHADTEEPETSMDSSETEVDMCTGAGAGAGSHRYHATAGTVSPYFIDSALPSDSDLNYDHHSSEEELEVINSSCCTAQPSPPPPEQQQSVDAMRADPMDPSLTLIGVEQREQLERHNHHHHHNHSHSHNRDSSSHNNSNTNSHSVDDSSGSALITRSRSTSTLPEKRKWSQVTLEASSAGAGARSEQGFAQSSTNRCHLSSQSVFTSAGVAVRRNDLSSGSSDEEVQGLLATPVQFRTSPPRGAHRPGRSFSPPPKLFHYATGQNSSPRKRHRHATPHAHAIQRPCLDFEKMQQLKARAVTAWRHSGDHGGELSVFCW